MAQTSKAPGYHELIEAKITPSAGDSILTWRQSEIGTSAFNVGEGAYGFVRRQVEDSLLAWAERSGCDVDAMRQNSTSPTLTPDGSTEESIFEPSAFSLGQIKGKKDRNFQIRATAKFKSHGIAWNIPSSRTWLQITN